MFFMVSLKQYTRLQLYFKKSKKSAFWLLEGKKLWQRGYQNILLFLREQKLYLLMLLTPESSYHIDLSADIFSVWTIT